MSKERVVYISAENISDYFCLLDGVLGSALTNNKDVVFNEFLDIPEGIHTVSKDCFIGYDNIKSITLANDVEKISENAFGRNVEYIKIGKKVKDICAKSFMSSFVLTEIKVHKANLYYQSIQGMILSKDGSKLIYAPQKSSGRFILDTMEREYSYPHGLKGVANKALALKFRKDLQGVFKKLTSVEDFGMAIFPEKIADDNNTYFVDQEFNLYWPKGLEKIGDFAFRCCYFYKTISFMDGLKHIGVGAFISCSKLETIHLPQSVEYIGSYVFMGCGRLKKLVLPDLVEIISKAMCKDCKSLVDVSIPSSCRIIEEEAFNNCKALTCVVIPDSVKQIGEKAFYGCENLEISISSSTKYAENSFNGCKKLIIR